MALNLTNFFHLSTQIILPTSFFAPLWYFTYILKNETIIIEKNENFVKSSLRNRTEILTSQGIQILSIPLKGGRHNTKKSITEVLIDNSTNWKIIQWRAICSAYGRSPYFLFYEDTIKALLFNTHDNLFEYNLSILKGILQLLKFEISIQYTTDYTKEYNSKYLDLRNIKKNEIHTPIQYTQCFEGETKFIPNLSIIDILMNCGLDTKNILMSEK